MRLSWHCIRNRKHRGLSVELLDGFFNLLESISYPGDRSNLHNGSFGFDYEWRKHLAHMDHSYNVGFERLTYFVHVNIKCWNRIVFEINTVSPGNIEQEKIMADVLRPLDTVISKD